MQYPWLFTVISVASIVVQVKSECTEEQLNKAKIVFKDCMDEKKASLLQTDVSEDEGHDFICSGLKDLSTGCEEPVTLFAVCRGREFVDNLVAIHLNAMAGGDYNPDVFQNLNFEFIFHSITLMSYFFRDTCPILPEC